jgi:hypothetical protein
VSHHRANEAEALQAKVLTNDDNPVNLRWHRRQVSVVVDVLAAMVRLVSDVGLARSGVPGHPIDI